MKFESARYQNDIDAPATHVLIVACGDYTEGGGLGLGELGPMDSPVLSAHALADWFMSGLDGNPNSHPPLDPEDAFYNPDAPLGSLVMLTSPMDDYQAPSGQAYQVDRPTLSNIKNAYREWLVRLKNNNSRGVFYFCGHGVGNGSSQTLLADDIGVDDADLWENSFNLSSTFDVTKRIAQAPILFLVDACFEFNTPSALQINAPIALVGKPANWRILSNPYLIRAAGTNERAYAEPGHITRFLESLLKSLKGHCGLQRPGHQLFDVTGQALKDATGQFLSRTNVEGVPHAALGETQGNGWGVSYHVFTRRPKVLVEIDVAPPVYLQTGYGFIQGHQSDREQNLFAGNPASFKVEQGTYHYGAGTGEDPPVEKEHRDQLLLDAVYSHRIVFPGHDS